MIEHYRQMVDDPLRIDLFARAIAAVVKPGDVVVDAGCGLGTYAICACRAGASRVYAIDSSPILEAAREVARHNGCADRITFVSGRSTIVDVVERAQVIVFEDYTAGLFAPQSEEVVRDLRERWLAPQGTLLPARARVWLAAVEDAPGHAEIDRLAAKRDRVADIDFAATRPRAFGTLHTRRLPATALVATPACVAEVSLGEDALDKRALHADVDVERDGTVHALLVWFDLQLADEWLGTGPTSPRSAWSQLVLPFATPLAVRRGERVTLSADVAPFGTEPLWRWSLARDGERIDGNSLPGMLLRPDTLALSRPDGVPRASEALTIDRFVLARVDGATRVDEIARALFAQFPKRFATVDAAHRRVVDVLGRY